MSGAPEENQQKDDAKVEEIQAEFRKLYGGGARQDESFGTRISREFKRNPFLPIGILIEFFPFFFIFF